MSEIRHTSWLVQASEAMWAGGAKSERERIIKLIEPHLEVCNYKAVTEEDCDVCNWVKMTITGIKEGAR